MWVHNGDEQSKTEKKQRPAKMYLVLVSLGNHVAGQVIHTLSHNFIQRIHDSLRLLACEPLPFQFLDESVGVKVVAAIVLYWGSSREDADRFD